MTERDENTEYVGADIGDVITSEFRFLSLSKVVTWLNGMESVGEPYNQFYFVHEPSTDNVGMMIGPLNSGLAFMFWVKPTVRASETVEDDFSAASEHERQVDFFFKKSWSSGVR